MNDWPLVADRPEIEKTRPFCLQVSEEEKPAHHVGLIGVFFRPPLVFAKDRSFRLFFFHALCQSLFLEAVGRFASNYGLVLDDWSRRPIVAGQRRHFDILDHAESQARIEIAHCLFIEVNNTTGS